MKRTNAGGRRLSKVEPNAAAGVAIAVTGCHPHVILARPGCE